MIIVKTRHLFLFIIVVHSVTCSVARTTEDRVKETTEPAAGKSTPNKQVNTDTLTTSVDVIPTGTLKPDKDKKNDSTFAGESGRTKVTRTKSNISSDIQIPVAVIYETTVSPTKRVGLKTRPDRFRKVRRLHSNNQFESRVAESLAKRFEITTYRPRNKEQNVLDYKVTQKEHRLPTSTEKSQKIIRKKDPVVRILDSENHVYSHKGEFHYSYESGDGTVAFGRGEMKKYPNDKPGESVEGGFSYTDKDGNDFSLSYTADENGYRPRGAHLPTPPPIPPAIARALQYLATKPTEEPVTYSYIDYV